MANGNNGRIKWNIFWMSVLWGVLASAMAFLFTKYTTLETRVTVIESTRFTSKDGRELENHILGQLPPPWLVEKVEKNERNIEFIKDNVFRVNNR